MKENTKKLPGFYIALSCCVVAIGVAGFIADNQELSETNNTTAAEVTEEPLSIVTSAPEEEVAEELAVIEEESMPTMLPQVAEIPDYAYDNPDIVAASVTVNAEESGMFCDPLSNMTTIFGFVGDTLVYNEYYGDWRTHNGVDLACDLGCSVNSIGDGTVIFVGDTSYGKTVKIDHGNGFISIYSCLGEVSVKSGDAIGKGAVIGTVGKSFGENSKEPHLHFEILKDGKPVNPEEY